MNESPEDHLHDRTSFTQEIQSLKNSIHAYVREKKRLKPKQRKDTTSKGRKRRAATYEPHKLNTRVSHRQNTSSKGGKNNKRLLSQGGNLDPTQLQSGTHRNHSNTHSSSSKQAASEFLHESEQFLEEIMQQMNRDPTTATASSRSRPDMNSIGVSLSSNNKFYTESISTSRTHSFDDADTEEGHEFSLNTFSLSHNHQRNTSRRKSSSLGEQLKSAKAKTDELIESLNISEHYDDEAYTLQEIESNFNLPSSSSQPVNNSKLTSTTRNDTRPSASDDQYSAHSDLSSLSSDNFSGDDDDASEMSLATLRLLHGRKSHPNNKSEQTHHRTTASSRSRQNPSQTTNPKESSRHSFHKLTKHQITDAPVDSEEIDHVQAHSEANQRNNLREKPYVPPLRIEAKKNSSKTSARRRTSARQRSLSARSTTSRNRMSSGRSSTSARRKPLQNHFSSSELVSIISRTLAKNSAPKEKPVLEFNPKKRNSLSKKDAMSSSVKKAQQNLEERYRTLNLSSLLDELPAHKRKTHTTGSNQVTYTLKSHAFPAAESKKEAISLAQELLKRRDKDMKAQRVKLKPSGKLARLEINSIKDSVGADSRLDVATQKLRPKLALKEDSDRNEKKEPASLAESLGLIKDGKDMQHGTPSVDDLIASVLRQQSSTSSPNQEDLSQSANQYSFESDEEDVDNLPRNVSISVLSRSPKLSLKSSLKKSRVAPRKKSVSWDYAVVNEHDRDDEEDQHEDSNQADVTTYSDIEGEDDASSSHFYSSNDDEEEETHTNGLYSTPKRTWKPVMSDDSARKKIYPPSFSVLLEDEMRKSETSDIQREDFTFEEDSHSWGDTFAEVATGQPGDNQGTAEQRNTHNRGSSSRKTTSDNSSPTHYEVTPSLLRNEDRFNTSPDDVDDIDNRQMDPSFEEADAYINRIRVLRAYLHQ